jgi:phenylpropionate dioxygenase-like ring-hydroxylating dioxygenase large terminal subunit
MSQLWSPSLLEPEWYWKPELFAGEQKTIFRNNWIFIGLKQDIAEPNDYISTHIAGIPVIVRNMKGKLVGFRNVCSHRHSLIHPEGCGNAMFRCPYHGWTYDADGVPIGIPDNAKSFGYDKEAKKALALELVAVDSCGDYVFARLAAEGPSLKTWLGPCADALELLSEFQPRVYGKIKAEWNCNWKSGVEITMEGYHAPFVHPVTFGKHVGMVEATETLGDAPLFDERLTAEPDSGFIKYADPHSMSRGSLSPDSQHHLDTIATRLRIKRSPQFSGFDHFAIYPNFMIGVNHGVNTCIQLYMPISAGHMEALCWLMTGEPDAKLDGGVIWETATKGWRDWTEKNWLEDQRACELVQTGVRHATRRAIIGHAEERLLHIQNLWKKEANGVSSDMPEEDNFPLRAAS